MPFSSKYERKQIAVMGRKGVGKSSLINALSVKNKTITSDNSKSNPNDAKQIMELMPFGPLYLVDTIGFDVESEVGKKRINNTIKTLSITDLVILVLDAREILTGKEWELLNYMAKISLPYIIAVNKIEYGVNPILLSEIKLLNTTHFEISCAENVGIDNLKTKVMRMLPQADNQPFVSDLVSQGDVAMMVVPNNLDAQKRREIIPQIQTIKEALDEDTTVVLTKIKELKSTLYTLKNLPDLILTDNSTVIDILSEVPEELKLTTFSILNARKKGDLQIFIKGLKTIESLKDNDKILVVEGCSHHEKNYIVDREQITDWLINQTNKTLIFDYNTGGDFPQDLSNYKLIIYCSACRLTNKIMHARIKQAVLLEIPIVNYDVLMSFINGSLPRILCPFEHAAIEWQKAD